jgi:hypothetical protein
VTPVQKDSEPAVALRQLSSLRIAAQGRWHVGWQVENRGAHPLTILSARLPHGQFKAEEKHFDPELCLAPGERRQFYVDVQCDEPAGEVTENAFVIFSVSWFGEAWRVFVRVRVTVGADGEPATTTESVTTQKIGFSGVAL